MKTIVCFGDSNTWGCIPFTSLDSVARFGYHDRWTGVLRAALGADYVVVEEGLNGRTTVWNDPLETEGLGWNKNGRMYLQPCLESHQPVDLVTIMLGTNDLKQRFGLPPSDLARGVGVLARVALASKAGPNGQAPQVLVICPPPLADNVYDLVLGEMFSGGLEKSKALAPHYEAIARENGCHFFDAGQVIVSSRVDGIHFDGPEHRKLGEALATRIRTLLA